MGHGTHSGSGCYPIFFFFFFCIHAIEKKNVVKNPLRVVEVVCLVSFYFCIFLLLFIFSLEKKKVPYRGLRARRFVILTAPCHVNSQG